jgi:hypothetical protein
MQMQWFSRLGKLINILLDASGAHGGAHRYGDARDPLRNILGPEAGARLKPIWGLDPEGEIRGAWRDLGIPRAWCMMGKSSHAYHGTATEPSTGNFALCRFHSTHIALRASS